MNESTIRITKNQRLATWNVRGLARAGKTQIVEREMQRYRVSVLGLSETHWRGSGHYLTMAGNTIYYSGSDETTHYGVAVIVSGEWNKAVTEYRAINDRIMLIRFNTGPCKLNMFQVYAPTSVADAQEREEFFQTLSSHIERMPKKEITLVLGDFNSKVGKETISNGVCGTHGLGNRNDSGEELIQFCQENEMIIANTWFQHHPRRIYTWISPDGKTKNQIDYCLVPSRWKSSMKNVKTYPGADCGTDHQLLCAEVKLKLRNRTKKPNFVRLEGTKELGAFKNRIKEKLEEAKAAEDRVNQGMSETGEQRWSELRDTFRSVAREVTANRKTKPKKSYWLSEETIKRIEERREVKARGGQSTAAYKLLNAKIQKGCRQDKNKYIHEICDRIEELNEQNETSKMFKEIKRLTRSFKARTWAIEDEDGNILTDKNEIAERWKTYCQELYRDSSGKLSRVPIPEEKEPSILKDEIRRAIAKLKNNKAPGADEITAEMLKASGEEGVDILYKVCNDIWNNGKWPKDWKKSVFIPLHKKGRTTCCGNHRTISLISHGSKVMLNVLHERLRYYIDRQIPQEQAGFVRGKGTREQILNIRQLIEKNREIGSPLILCFIDYNKAFDCVKWEELWKALDSMGVPPHLTAIMRNLYTDGLALVRLQDNESGLFEPSKGVRQGCILSPTLFNIYSECIFQRCLEGWNAGVNIGGQQISNLRFADDTTLCAKSMEEMAELVKKVEDESFKFGLTINRGKTKIMIVDRTGVLPESTLLQEYERVDTFVYLGSLVDKDGGSTKEIRRRIILARAAVSKLTVVWKDAAITRRTKLRLLHTLVFPVLLYGAETWTIKMADRRSIDAFEMWAYRRLLRIPWTARRTNVSIINELNIRTRLSTICDRRILKFFGHIIRRPSGNLEKLVVQGKVEGKRLRGRSPKRWIDQVKEISDQPLERALRRAEDRTDWELVVEEIG